MNTLESRLQLSLFNKIKAIYTEYQDYTDEILANNRTGKRANHVTLSIDESQSYSIQFQPIRIIWVITQFCEMTKMA